MAKEYIPLFLDFNETTQDLSDDECGRLIRAIIEYANDREYEQLLTGAERIAFRFLKGVIDRNQAISEARARAGSSKREQQATNENKSEQPITNIVKEKEKEKEKEKKKFVPPTLEEVTAYCNERKNGVNPQKFIDFYESKGWKVGNQSMKDWKASVRTWESGDKKKVIAQQYGQRDYSSEQDDAMSRMLKQMQEGA